MELKGKRTAIITAFVEPETRLALKHFAVNKDTNLSKLVAGILKKFLKKHNGGIVKGK